MSYRVELVRVIKKTPLGKEIRRYLLRRNGKVVGRRMVTIAEKRTLRRALTKAEEAAVKEGREAITVVAEQLYKQLSNRYAFLKHVDPEVWRATVFTLMTRGRREFKALRGLVVEAFVPSMKEMQALEGDARSSLSRETRGSREEQRDGASRGGSPAPGHFEIAVN